MNITSLGNDCYSFFINTYFYSLDKLDKDNLLIFIKDLLMDYKFKLNLKGFYKVNCFVYKDCYIFNKLIKLDDLTYNKVDFRIVINDIDVLLFETDNYEIISKYKNVIYFNNKYYINYNEIDNINILEFGDFTYGDDVDRIFNLGKHLN